MVLNLHQWIWVLKLATNNALYNKSSLAIWEFAILHYNIQSVNWIHLGVENFFLVSEVVTAANFKTGICITWYHCKNLFSYLFESVSQMIWLSFRTMNNHEHPKYRSAPRQTNNENVFVNTKIFSFYLTRNGKEYLKELKHIFMSTVMLLFYLNAFLCLFLIYITPSYWLQMLSNLK